MPCCAVLCRVVSCRAVPCVVALCLDFVGAASLSLSSEGMLVCVVAVSGGRLWSVGMMMMMIVMQSFMSSDVG